MKSKRMSKEQIGKWASRDEMGCVAKFGPIHIARMQGTVKIALVGAGMFGGDVHARAYADLQRAGISAQLGRIGLDEWARDFAGLNFELAAVGTRTEKSARRAQEQFRAW